MIASARALLSLVDVATIVVRFDAGAVVVVVVAALAGRVRELEDGRRVLGVGPARRHRVDPPHDVAVRVGLDRLEHDLVLVVGQAVGVDRELAELLRARSRRPRSWPSSRSG